MLTIEYCKGEAVIERETSAAHVMSGAYAKAMLRAKKLGADKVRFFDTQGHKVGVYPVPKTYDADG